LSVERRVSHPENAGGTTAGIFLFGSALTG
jgi:hypothetical protein